MLATLLHILRNFFISVDYTPLAGAPVTFNPGSTTATVTVTVADDALVENTEQFTLSLTSNNQNVAISPTQNQATGNILDNDSTPQN